MENAEAIEVANAIITEKLIQTLMDELRDQTDYETYLSALSVIGNIIYLSGGPLEES